MGIVFHLHFYEELDFNSSRVEVVIQGEDVTNVLLEKERHYREIVNEKWLLNILEKECVFFLNRFYTRKCISSVTIYQISFLIWSFVMNCKQFVAAKLMIV